MDFRKTLGRLAVLRELIRACRNVRNDALVRSFSDFTKSAVINNDAYARVKKTTSMIYKENILKERMHELAEAQNYAWCRMFDLLSLSQGHFLTIVYSRNYGEWDIHLAAHPSAAAGP